MFICLDVESGGLTKDCSLLTAYFGILDDKFNLVRGLDLKLIPDDGVYKVTAQGLSVNKIDLVKLAEEGMTYKEAKTFLYNFLQQYAWKKKLTPIGQNVQFDIQFIEDVIISKGSWDNFVSRRPLDTMYIATYLKTIGKLPEDQSVSLGNLIEYFDIKVEGNQHEARYDALATVEVLKKLIGLGK